MTNRTAPYRHPDGSNCWTKNCRLGGQKISFTLPPVGDIGSLNDMLSVNSHIAEQCEEKKNSIQWDMLQPLPHYRGALTEKQKTFVNNFNNLYGMVSQLWSPEHLEELQRYTALRYVILRQYLTDPDRWRALLAAKNPEIVAEREQKLKRSIKILDELTRSPLHFPAPLYRVITPETDGFPYYSAEDWAENLNLTPGNVIKWDSYASTSFDPHIIDTYLAQTHEEQTGIVFKFNKIKHGVIVGETITDNNTGRFTQDYEREVLLPRETQYRVVSVHRNSKLVTDERKINPLIVELEEI